MKKRANKFVITLASFLLFSGGIAPLHGQEPPLPPDDETITIQVLSPEQKRADMDIKTSRLVELAAWCRSLGLSEGGTYDDLARRLREHFQITAAAAAGAEDKRKIITIESARSTEYFKLEAVDEEYARLTGEVQVSLKDGDAVHRIKAWNILFNRTRNLLTASGGVEYIKEEGDKIETFRGDSITVDLDNWSSIFLGGVSERSLQGDGTTYLFSGTVISRNEEDVTILNKATISNANNEESLWSLNASRVWLLPGSDFAIFNAVLKVGEIPLMYIPFFYYPADEVVFHPVIGFRTREGNFVQTTTYLMGRPRASSASQSSLTKILGNSSDMEKKREGLFLRSTGKKAVDQSATSLKAIFDYYANLGGYAGLDFTTPQIGILGNTSITFGIGLTRSIANLSGTYTPFYPDYDGSSDWNKSNLFSMDVPFRYRFEMSSSISGKYGGLSWSLPYYSDPWVDSDFVTNRAEEMDWVNMIQKGASLEAEQSTENQKGAYTWQLSGTLNPKFPNMAPWITGISISGISSTVSFKTKDLTNTYPATDIRRYSPSRAFYVPDIATLYSISGSLAGTPLTLGGAAPASTNAGAAKPEPPEDRLKNIGVPRSPWQEEEATGAEKEKQQDPADKLTPPVLNQRFDLPRAGNANFNIGYRFAPTSASQLQFRSSKWNEYSDINWGDVSNVLSSVSGDAGVTVNMSHTENWYAGSFSYNGNGAWRQYSYINEEAEEYLDAMGNPDPTKIEAAKKAQYNQSNFSTSYSSTVTLRPLVRDSVFGASNIQHSLSGLAVRSKFIGSGDDPEWELEYADWTTEKITAHSFSTNIAARVMDKEQSFTMSAELPPKDSALSFNTAIRAWITETTANMRILFPGEEERRKFQPFTATERFSFGTYGSFTYNLVLDTEIKEFTSMRADLSLSKWGLSASYAARRMLGYEFVPGATLGTGEWKQRPGGNDDQSLQSENFTMNYAKTFSQKDLWGKRLNFSVNFSTALNINLQQYTSSAFTFTLGGTLGINHFLQLSVSANSRNDKIFWYYNDWSLFSDIPDELRTDTRNLFTDLVNSFRFDDDSLRRDSPFKMNSFTLSATHHLGEWDAILTWSMAPYRTDTRPPKIEIDNTVSFVVQWKAITEIKSDIKYNKRKDEWAVKGLSG